MNPIDTLQYNPFLSTCRPPSLWSRIQTWWRKKEPTQAPPDPAAYSPCNPEERLDEYRLLLPEARSIWVFRNGTCVQSGELLSESEAVDLMRDLGPVEIGSRSGDFFVGAIESPVAGFVVKYHFPQLVSFVPRAEYPPDCPPVLVGSLVRLGRSMDALDLHVVAHWSAEMQP